MDKFKQLFTLLKGIITERKQDREQSKDKHDILKTSNL